jgi:hypothetical protein
MSKQGCGSGSVYHHFGKTDPHPHQCERPDPDQHQSQKEYPDPHQNSVAVKAHVGAMEGNGRSQRMRRFALL